MYEHLHCMNKTLMEKQLWLLFLKILLAASNN